MIARKTKTLAGLYKTGQTGLVAGKQTEQLSVCPAQRDALLAVSTPWLASNGLK